MVPADEWFRSNAAGMALEKSVSRTNALRNTYALLVETPPVREVPPYLAQYYSSAYRIERRTLYEKGRGARRQWLFIDNRGRTRMVCAFSLNAGKDTGNSDDTSLPSGTSTLIELYGGDSLITEEHRIGADGDDYLTRYIYNKGVLIRAETRLKRSLPPEDTKTPAPTQEIPAGEEAESLGAERENPYVRQDTAEADSGPVNLEEAAPPERTENTDRRRDGWEDILTDYYRYTRSSSLRAVERVYHQDRVEDDYLVRIRFPFLSPGIQQPEGLTGAVSAQADSTVPSEPAVFSAPAAGTGPIKAGSRVKYTTDNRGRVLTETHEDESGKISLEIKNTWSLDRLMAVVRKSGGDEEHTEYSYNAEGDRILERNYKNGTINREVRREGGREVEVLYMNGRPVLQAVWEDGRKVSEEPIRTGAGGRNR
jgi:hypothetical protein